MDILYVDDELENLTSFKYLFKKKFQITLANSASEALNILKEENVQVVISDQRMPEMTGIEFLEKVSIEHPDVIRILLTGYTDILTMEEAIGKGKIYKCMSKPFEMNEMAETLKEAFALYAQENQNK